MAVRDRAAATTLPLSNVVTIGCAASISFARSSDREFHPKPRVHSFGKPARDEAAGRDREHSPRVRWPLRTKCLDELRCGASRRRRRAIHDDPHDGLSSKRRERLRSRRMSRRRCRPSRARLQLPASERQLRVDAPRRWNGAHPNRLTTSPRPARARSAQLRSLRLLFSSPPREARNRGSLLAWSKTSSLPASASRTTR